MSDLFRGEVLAAMQERRVGISGLARKTGIHRNVLGRWLAGSGTIRLDQFVRVARSVGLEVVVRRGQRGR